MLALRVIQSSGPSLIELLLFCLFNFGVHNNNTHAFAGQLNRVTHLRALLVLHNRGIFGPGNQLRQARAVAYVWCRHATRCFQSSSTSGGRQGCAQGGFIFWYQSAVRLTAIDCAVRSTAIDCAVRSTVRSNVHPMLASVGSFRAEPDGTSHYPTTLSLPKTFPVGMLSECCLFLSECSLFLSECSLFL